MRWLTRLILGATLLAVVAALMIFAIVNPENVEALNQSLSNNHWKFTSFRLIGFATLLGGIYFVRNGRLNRSPNEEPDELKALFKIRLIRVGIWLTVVELALGQGLIPRLIGFLSS